MRSIKLVVIAVVLCGGALLLSCKKHETSTVSQPQPDTMSAAKPAASPVASPQAATSPVPAATATPEAKAAAPAAKPAASSVVMVQQSKQAEPTAASLDRFAKCLTQKGVTMYGHYLCPHCAEQKEKFGESFEFVHYFECGTFGQPMTVQNQTCKDMQITRYPTWVFADGERISAIQTMEQLSQKTGCKLQ